MSAPPFPAVSLARTGELLRVGKILAAGRNYGRHILEMHGRKELPLVFFSKLPTAIVHDGATVRLPKGAGTVHHEVELVVVVGKRGRRIPERYALDHVLGYAVGVDLTLRDLQNEARRRGEPWTVSKGFDGAAPISAAVPLAEVGDGSSLRIRLEVNGKVRQDADTSEMIYPVPSLVSLASRWITLDRGDLLFTGSPAGVGPVEPGDLLRAEIEKVGSLTIRFEEDDAAD